MAKQTAHQTSEESAPVPRRQGPVVRRGGRANRRWPAAAGHTFQRFARALVQGRYRRIEDALPDCLRELRERGLASGRTESAVYARLHLLAEGMGRKRWHQPWLPGELEVIEVFARAVVRGKYRSANSAVADCGRALEAAGLSLNRLPKVLSNRLRWRVRELGGASFVKHWTAVECRRVEQFARALKRGEYPTASAAAQACSRALREARTGVRRTRAATQVKIERRAHALGWRPVPTEWTPAELQVVDHFARAIVTGQTRTAAGVLAECRSALKAVAGPMPRTDQAIRRRLNMSARAAGRPWQPHFWTAAEDRIVERFAQAVMRGKYPKIAAAIPDCRRALARAGSPAQKLGHRIGVRITKFTAELGLGPEHSVWHPGQERIAARFARLVLAGRYPDAPSATRDCAAEIEAWNRRHPNRSTPHAEGTVTAMLWRLLVAWKLPRAGGRWSAAEIAVIDRYIHAVVAHRYRNLLQAVPDCWQELREVNHRVLKPVLHSGRQATARNRPAVHAKLVARVKVIARYRVPHRFWTRAELMTTAHWVKRYDRFRRGLARANLRTLGGMMRDQLDRQGYYRTQPACERKILELYRAG